MFFALFLGVLLGIAAPSTSKRVFAEGPQDPPPAPPTEQVEFQDKMASSDPEEWVRALGRLSAYFDSDRLAKEPWVRQVLRRYVIEQAGENPARTRKILSDRTMVERKEPCESILLELLASESSPFLPDVTDALVAVAADPARRQGLLSHLEKLGLTEDRFARLFAIIARHDPQATIRVAIHRLDADVPAESARSVIEALHRLLGVNFADAAACREWWKQNERTPISDWLRQRDRQRLIAETTQIWQQALQHLQPNKNAFREFLLDSLDRSPEIRREGIRQVQERLSGLFQGEVALLQPFVDKLLAIAREPTADASIRLQALMGLESFVDFSGYEPLVASLSEWIGTPEVVAQRKQDPKAATAYAFSLAAVRVAGKLKCALSVELEAILESVLVTDESGICDWDRDSDDLVATLLESISRIGPRRMQPATEDTPGKPGNLTLMKRIFESRVPTDATRAEKRIKVHDLVVKMLGQWRALSPPNAEDESVLELLNQALERRAGLARRLAIIGLGTLRLPEGISPLEVVVKGGSDPGNRSEAAKSIYTIGGQRAVVAFRGLLSELKEDRNQELRQQIVRHAEDLCATDPTLGLLSEYVFPKEERTAWFARLIDEPTLARLVSTDQVKLDRQEVLNAWLTLRIEIAKLLLERAEQATPENEGAAYQRLAASTQEVLDYRSSHPDLQFRRIEELTRLRFTAGRAELIDALSRGDYAALAKGLEDQVAKLTKTPSTDPRTDANLRLSWVVRRIERAALANPESRVPEEFIESIDRIQRDYEVQLGEEWTRIREVLRQKPVKKAESSASG